MNTRAIHLRLQKQLGKVLLPEDPPEGGLPGREELLRVGVDGAQDQRDALEGVVSRGRGEGLAEEVCSTRLRASAPSQKADWNESEARPCMYVYKDR